MDLVQIRWQQIRSAEALQIVESENISLKKAVSSLRDKSALLAHEASQADLKRKQALLIADKDRRVSINVTGMECVRRLLNDLRSDMTQLKQQWIEQQSWFSSQSNLLRESCRSFQSHLSVAQKEVEKVEMEKKSIISESEFTRQAALLATLSLHEKIAMLEGSITRSDGDLRYVKGRNAILLTEFEKSEALVEVHVRGKMVVEHEKEELRRAMDIMQQRIDQLTADNSIAVADLNDRTHLLRMNYEKIIEELSVENEQLRKICTEQEDRITMITSNLLGKKSNFTRYVEVKAENLTLQSKLDLLESQRASAARARVNRPTATPLLVREMEHILPAHQRKAKALIAAVEELHSERAFPIICDATNRRHVPVKAESIIVDKLDAQSIDDAVSMTSYEKELSPRKNPRIIFPPKEIIVSQSSNHSLDTDGPFVERVLRVSKRSAPEVSPRSNSTPLNSIGFESRQRQQQANSSSLKAKCVKVPKSLSSVRIEGVAAPTGLINSISHPPHRIASEVFKLNQKFAIDERLSGTCASQSDSPPKSDKTLSSTGDDHIVLFPSIAKKDRYIL